MEHEAAGTPATKPCKVRRLTIIGAKRTKTALLEKYIAKAVKDAKTVGELYESLSLSTQSLQKLHIFKSINITVDAHVDDDGTTAFDPNEAQFHVKALVKEPDYPFSLKFSTSARVGPGRSGAQPDVESSAGLHNLFGTAETLSFSTRFATTTASNWDKTFMIRYENPLVLYGDDSNVDVQLYKTSIQYPDSSINNKLHALAVAYKKGNHTWTYEGAWREISLSSSASYLIRKQAGHSFKSSLKYNWIKDLRDHPILPTKGSALSLSAELAGLGGNVKFWKSEAAFQTNLPFSFWKNATLNWLVKGGIFVPLQGDTPRVVDRFSFGGATCIRGYGENSIGQKMVQSTGSAATDYLGGDLYLSSGLHLTFPLPSAQIPPTLVKGQLFWNAGNNVPYTVGQSLNCARALQSGWKNTIGAGLVFNTQFGRIELNLNHALGRKPDDVVHPWQIGFSLQFI